MNLPPPAVRERPKFQKKTSPVPICGTSFVDGPYADPMEINDADFQPTDSQTDVKPESRVTVDKLRLFK